MKHYPLLALSLSLLGSPLLAQDTERVSVGLQGVEADGPSFDPHVSADGRFVVFTSDATNLHAADDNSARDVFLHDRQSGSTALVSRATDGTSPTGLSREPSISANGRWIAYQNQSLDHVEGPGGGVYLWDRLTDTHLCASRDANGVARQGESPHVSPDGRYVVFLCTFALVPGDSNTADDVYRYDRVTNTTTLVSTDANGVQSGSAPDTPSVSSFGRYVAFVCTASNWGAPYVGMRHVWVRDLQTGALEVASATATGEPATNISYDPEISADGRYVAMLTVAANLLMPPVTSLQVVVKDRLTGAVEQVSVNDAGQAANNYCYEPRMSADGRFVAFRTGANNLHMGGSVSYYSVFVRDRVLDQTRKISLSTAASGSMSGTDDSYPGGVSLTGRYAAFSSQASTLVPNDLAGHQDIFVRDTQDGSPAVFGWSEPQSVGCVPSISSSGTPSASAGSGFVIACSQVRGSQFGLMIYSRTGPQPTPMSGGYLYGAAPIVRTPIQNSGGGSPSNCNGSFAYDFNTRIASGIDPQLVPGLSIVAQYWSRDAGLPAGSHLSDALAFVIGN